MVSKITEQEVLGQLGSPAEVAKELEKFRKTARVLSASHPRLLDRYNKQWIAVYEGKVQAQGRTLRSLMSQVDAKRLPREHIIVRLINRDQRTMIL